MLRFVLLFLLGTASLVFFYPAVAAIHREGDDLVVTAELVLQVLGFVGGLISLAIVAGAIVARWLGGALVDLIFDVNQRGPLSQSGVSRDQVNARRVPSTKPGQQGDTSSGDSCAPAP